MHKQTESNPHWQPLPRSSWRAGRVAALLVLLSALMLAGGMLLGRQFSAQAQPASKVAAAAASEPAGQMPSRRSRSRPACARVGLSCWAAAIPSGPSCVTVMHSGEVRDTPPTNPGDWNGGPGTTMATLYYFDRQNNKSPMQDFNWHQGRLKTYLQNESAINLPAEQMAHQLAEQANLFCETASAWSNFPPTLRRRDSRSKAIGRATAWPRPRPAVAAKDLKQT